MKAEDYHKLESERELLEKVVALALLKGWYVHHVLDTRVAAKRMGQPGFPDLVLVKNGHLIIAELKSQKGRLSFEQEIWLLKLNECFCMEVFRWRPSDWPEIESVLTKGGKP